MSPPPDQDRVSADDPPPDRRRPGPPPCPICGRPAAPALRPFCSERCADIDLGRWLSDRYVIPADEDEEPRDDAGRHP